MKELLKKIQKARCALTNLGPTGKNKHNNYVYLELGDFLKDINKQGEDLGFTTQFSIERTEGHDEAIIRVHDHDSDNFIDFRSPFIIATIRAANDLQNLGAAITYMRRYLLMMAFEIRETDAIDSLDQKKDFVKEPPVRTEASVAANLSHKKQYPTYGFCSACFAPMYLSQAKTSIYCSNYKTKTDKDGNEINHERGGYKGEEPLPNEIKNFNDWMLWKNKQKQDSVQNESQATSDIPF